MRLPRALDPDVAEVARGATVSLILKLAGALLAFAFNVVLARLLGTDPTGIYFLAFAVLMVASIVGRLGLDNVVLRLTVAAAATSDWRAVVAGYRSAMRAAALAALGAALAVALAAPLLADVLFRKPMLEAPLRWMSLAVVPFVLAVLHAEALKGLKRIAESQLVQAVLIPGLSLILLLVLGQRGVVGAVWAYVLACLAAWIAGTVLWRRALRNCAGTAAVAEEGGPSSIPVCRLLDSGLPLLWVASLTYLLGFASTFFLGFFRTEAEVALFGAAARTAMLTSFLLLATNAILAPKFAELYERRDLARLGAMARHWARWLALLALPVLALFLAIPGTVMSVFGAEFREAAPALSILAVGQFVNVAVGSVGYLLMMSAHERDMRNNVTVAGVVSLVLNLVLIPRFGFVGASAATSGGLIVLNILGVVAVRRRLGIRMFATDRADAPEPADRGGGST
jgi:O-antigen/teichoic acid export membrane protein